MSIIIVSVHFLITVTVTTVGTITAVVIVVILVKRCQIFHPDLLIVV